ncbi:M50 family metallopeptidase [Kytococcus sp. Marseille-QA3725]
MDQASGWRIGSVRGVPVYLGRTWPLLVVLVVFLNGSQLSDRLGPATAYGLGVAYAVMLVFSVFVHELGHVLAAQSRGYEVTKVQLDLIGGHTAHQSDNTSPGSNALVAVAGPLANLALAGLAAAALLVVPEGLLHMVVASAVWVNGLVGLFNLLPGMPLDGGHVVDSLVWKATGDRPAGLVVAGWTGRVIAVVVIALVAFQATRGGSLTMVLWGGLIAFVLWAGASRSIQAGSARRELGRHSTGSVMRPAVGLPQDEPVSALLGVRGFPVPVSVVTTDHEARAVGLVDPSALAQVPGERRESTPLSAVARTVPGDWTVDAAPQEDITRLVEAVSTRGLKLAAIRQHGAVGPDGRALPPQIVGLADHESLDQGMRANIRQRQQPSA